MDNDAARRYYKKISTTFRGVNRNDAFAKKFLEYLKSADTKIYQKERKERRIFDDTWIQPVEDILPVIDKLTRNPREMLKKYSYVVAVERAKKVDSESIRHLAANTHLIRDTKLDGTVVPKKILTSYSDSSLGTYENRFLKSLVDKLYKFIELRYDLIIRKMNTEYINHLGVTSGFEVGDTRVNYDITFRVHRDIGDDDLGKKNQELFKKMRELRRSIGIYKMSKFMKDMAEFQNVKPPIMKTNIIMKDVDFQKCYAVWMVLDQVDFIGYDVDFFERNIKFDEEYLSQIENSILVLYATLATKQIEDFVFAKDEPFDYKKRRAPKTSTSNPNDEYLDPEIVRFEDNRINQYYLDQIRQVTQARYDNILSSGISREETIKILYNQLIKIADDALKDFVINNFKTDDTLPIEEQLENQKQVVKIYREVEKLKRENLKEFSTEKAIAILTYQNLKDKYDKIQEEEKARIEAEQEQERQAKLEEDKQKAIERLAKRRKIERAQKILDEAEEKRNNKSESDDDDDDNNGNGNSSNGAGSETAVKQSKAKPKQTEAEPAKMELKVQKSDETDEKDKEKFKEVSKDTKESEPIVNKTFEESSDDDETEDLTDVEAKSESSLEESEEETVSVTDTSSDEELEKKESGSALEHFLKSEEKIENPIEEKKDVKVNKLEQSVKTKDIKEDADSKSQEDNVDDEKVSEDESVSPLEKFLKSEEKHEEPDKQDKNKEPVRKSSAQSATGRISNRGPGSHKNVKPVKGQTAFDFPNAIPEDKKTENEPETDETKIKSPLEQFLKEKNDEKPSSSKSVKPLTGKSSLVFDDDETEDDIKDEVAVKKETKPQSENSETNVPQNKNIPIKKEIPQSYGKPTPRRNDSDPIDDFDSRNGPRNSYSAYKNYKDYVQKGRGPSDVKRGQTPRGFPGSQNPIRNNVKTPNPNQDKIQTKKPDDKKEDEKEENAVERFLKGKI